MADAIKLTNREVLSSSQAMMTLGLLKLPAKVAYAIAKAANKLLAIENTIREVQKKLWDKYGEKDESGKLKVDPTNSTITIPQAQRSSFDKEFEDLMSEKNEIAGLRQITITELGDAKLEPALLAQLEWFLKEE